jgi:hypothetical protein
MYLSVNTSAKDFLEVQFQYWYVAQVVITTQIKPRKINLSITKMKPLGAKWLNAFCRTGKSSSSVSQLVSVANILSFKHRDKFVNIIFG